MNQNIIDFPVARVTRAASDLPRRAAKSTIVSLERWKRAAHPLRTANGVFFITGILDTTGDFA